MEKFKNISAKEIIIGNNCQIADNVQINVRGRFEIGALTFVEKRNEYYRRKWSRNRF